MERALSILFAGGCHLAGFPVGAKNSLARVALRRIGHPEAENPAVLLYVNLRSAVKVEQACRQSGAEVLVLQLGHYETMPLLRRMLRSGGMSGWSVSRPIRDPHPREPEARPEARFRWSMTSRLIFARRVALGILFYAIGLGRRIFDGRALTAELDEMLELLGRLPLKAILLVAPFSCPDPLTRFCRRRAHRLFVEAARRHGCILVDAFVLLESFAPGASFEENFADPNHLSLLGHERVGALLGRELARVLEQGA